jgi:hypothetical protein
MASTTRNISLGKAAADILSSIAPPLFVDGNADGLAHGPQLLDGGRALDVGGDEHRVAALLH